MVKDVDLTYSLNQRKQGLKEVVLPNGSIKKVPLKEWVRTIIKDPKGATASRAKEKKDPDLEKIKIPSIYRGGFEKPNLLPEKILDPEAKRQRRESKQTDLTYGLSPETAKRRGYMKAEEGKEGLKKE